LCSKSFLSAALPGLPVAGVAQSSQQAEVELREGVQGIVRAAPRRAILAVLKGIAIALSRGLRCGPSLGSLVFSFLKFVEVLPAVSNSAKQRPF
jgi:hypothetical protein